MHVVSRAPFDTATRQFPNQAAALDDVYRTLKRENYTSPDEMKKRFASLDRMKYRIKHIFRNGNIAYFKECAANEVGVGGIKSRKGLTVVSAEHKIHKNYAEYDKLTDFYRRTKE